MSEANNSKKYILVVDDDVRIRQMLIRYFEDEGFVIHGAQDGGAMNDHLKRYSCDIILLDVSLPGGKDGFQLAREVRAQSDIPIIMLTARDDVVDRIVGFEIGADDYIPKPFHLREVLARVKSVLRRGQVARESAEPEVSDVMAFNGWQLSLSRRELLASDGRTVDLTTGEFDLLAVFVRQPGHVFTREALMDLTHGRRLEVFDRTIDAQIVRLRRKIETDPKKPTLIKSVRGVGYVFTGKAGV